MIDYRPLHPDCYDFYESGIHKIIHSERQRFFSNALFFLRCNGFWGNYFEFGVYQAWTFRQVMLTAESYGMHDMGFIAFDSFEGFPQLSSDDYSGQWGFHTEGGTRAMSEEDFRETIRRDVPHHLHKTRTVAGFYDQSLTPETAAEVRTFCTQTNGRKDPRASLVTVDCDLYESAVPVFQFIDDFIDQGSVIYIDDYWVGYSGNPNEGVAKAFKEYKTTSEFDFVDWGRIGGWGHSFVAQRK